MATSTRTKIGHALAKILGIKLDYRTPHADLNVSRGESVFSVDSADTYVEEEPTAAEWLRDNLIPTTQDITRYARSLFPFTHWITRYNVQWLMGDLVAGITIGAVVVPQGMAYAILAELAPQFGLYTSFMGVLIYWFFATSKDITIGPVAVMSTITGNVVSAAAITNPDIPGNVIASALAIICGAIICFIGLIRWGWIVDFISLASVAAFITGSAINIAVGQVPTMMGITGFSTRDSTYLVFVHILKHLGRTKLDAAMGLTALAMLYTIRSACAFAAKRNPAKGKQFFFISTLRTAFVILLYTMISWLVNRHREKPAFKILGTVPRGFKNAAVPKVDKTIIKAFVGQLPASVIVLLIEHIAIAKSFGRVNNYTINPSQELVAIGVTNLLGPFLGAYPATGSFSRTAIKSKAGVRTPFAGVITALVVLLAIYALPAVFFWIPSASLSAVIIHAVLDLIAPPNTIYQFWQVSPLEVLIFFIGVIVTVFLSIENGIYTTICVSLAVFLVRFVKARGRFLGKVTVHSVIGDHLLGEERKPGGPSGQHHDNDPDDSARNVFLPIEHADGSNPQIEIDQPYPGIFIYRFSEGFNYPNANAYLDYMVATIFSKTRRTNMNSYPRLGDRPWNDPGPPRGKPEPDHSDRPTLKAIILDFSSVNNVDITSVQQLIDVRNQLDRYTAPARVEWHMACINNRWTKRALASAGFGFPTPDDADPAHFSRWKPVFSVAELGGQASAAQAAEWLNNERELRRLRSRDEEQGRQKSLAAVGRMEGDVVQEDSAASSSSVREEFAMKGGVTESRTPKRNAGGSRVAVVQGLNRPLFHVDLTSALQSAVAHAKLKEEAAERPLGKGFS